MNGFPFDPEKLARLAALSRSLAAAGAPPPIDAPVVVDEGGYIWMPAPGDADEAIGHYVYPGLRLGWIPVPEQGGIILWQLGGPDCEEGFEEDGLATFLTRDGFRRYIADLQAIDAQLGDASEIRSS